MEMSVMGVNVPASFEANHRSPIHPAGFVLHSNRIAVPQMIPYRQGDRFVIRPVHLLFLPKAVGKFVGMSIRAGDGKMLRRTLHIKIQTDQQRIKAAIADNAAFQADAGQQLPDEPPGAGLNFSALTVYGSSPPMGVISVTRWKFEV